MRHRDFWLEIIITTITIIGITKVYNNRYNKGIQ